MLLAGHSPEVAGMSQIGVTSKAKLIAVGSDAGQLQRVSDRLREHYEVTRFESLEQSLESLHNGDTSGLLLFGDKAAIAGLLMQAGQVLQSLPSGFVLLDQNRRVLWHNARFGQLTNSVESLVGRNFYHCFTSAEILGPDFCPLNTAFATNEPARSTLRVGDKTFYEVEATPIFEGDPDIPQYLALIIRDTSHEVLQKQKLNAIYQAGLELSDLTPQELLEMSVEERIELLKSKILHFTDDLLEYDTVEIRLLDRSTKRLDPLLAVGMNTEAEQRILHANPQNNGVTGFVAATGKSYLCEDTTSDPLYLQGAPEAHSSLTVPLMWHDEVLGTFNVESPRAGAFTENDLQFLELFAREIAMALNTLELLTVEKISSVTQSAETILCHVGQPVDEVIHATTWVLENTIGVDRQVTERLRDILKHTRDIKQLIQQVGDEMRPKVGANYAPTNVRSKMQHKRVMVVDADDEVRRAAHELLGRFGCEVETAPEAKSAFLLARSYHYDAVIADIRLPDHDGYETFSQLKQIDANLAVILMTGYGYDPTHSIVKSRQAGLKSVLYKPFRIDQLIQELEKAFSCTQAPA